MMDKRKARLLWTIVLVAEAIILLAMLLCDLGVLQSKIDPLSLKGLIYQAVAVVLIVISVNNISKLK